MQQFEPFLNDLRAGLRSIRKSLGFSLVVILTLALGIGINTAVFSVAHAVLLQPLPYPNGERLVEIWEATSGQRIPVSWINFQRWLGENHTFEEMAGFETADLTLTGRGDAVLTRAGVVSSGFYCPPSTGGCAKGWYSISEMPAPPQSDVPLTILTRVDPDYFRTLN
jgi:putative ABC transport system permease protein